MTKFHQNLKLIIPENLAKAFDTIQHIENNILYVCNDKAEFDKFIELKRLIEYKYFIPIEAKNDILYFSGYSTHKFLKLLEPCLSDVKKRRLKFDKLIKLNQDAKISVYAAGAIEKAPDHGIGYRKKLKELLQLTKVLVVSPCDFEYNKKFSTMIEFQKNHNLQETKEHFERIIDGDLRAVNQTDATVVYLDKYLGTGSISECSVARFLNKPVYGILDNDFRHEDIKPWLLGCLTRIFSSYQSFREFVIGE